MTADHRQVVVMGNTYSPVEVYKQHLMWSWRKQYQKIGKNYAYIRTIYICSGCGFEAFSEEERHQHTVNKIIEAKQMYNG